jgi:HSP20 family protein
MNDQQKTVPPKGEGSKVPAASGEWTPFESLRREIDRIFDDFHPSEWRWPSIRRSAQGQNWPVAPAMDLVERQGEYEITAELPGIDEKDVEVKVINRMLTIRGEKNEQKEEKQKDYYLSERRFGSFQRSFQLPEGADADKIEAHFAKGVLTVKVPKTAGMQKPEKKISIKSS